MSLTKRWKETLWSIWGGGKGNTIITCHNCKNGKMLLLQLRNCLWNNNIIIVYNDSCSLEGGGNIYRMISSFFSKLWMPVLKECGKCFLMWHTNYWIIQILLNYFVTFCDDKTCFLGKSQYARDVSKALVLLQKTSYRHPWTCKRRSWDVSQTTPYLVIF